ncbi:MAG: hypothetical protein WC651_01460 [Candidatus Gracilibacteria bacterium]
MIVEIGKDAVGDEGDESGVAGAESEGTVPHRMTVEDLKKFGSVEAIGAGIRGRHRESFSFGKGVFEAVLGEESMFLDDISAGTFTLDGELEAYCLSFDGGVEISRGVLVGLLSKGVSVTHIKDGSGRIVLKKISVSFNRLAELTELPKSLSVSEGGRVGGVVERLSDSMAIREGVGRIAPALLRKRDSSVARDIGAREIERSPGTGRRSGSGRFFAVNRDGVSTEVGGDGGEKEGGKV